MGSWDWQYVPAHMVCKRCGERVWSEAERLRHDDTHRLDDLREDLRRPPAKKEVQS